MEIPPLSHEAYHRLCAVRTDTSSWRWEWCHSKEDQKRARAELPSFEKVLPVRPPAVQQRRNHTDFRDQMDHSNQLTLQ